MKIKCYPKINLALDILGQDQNGFHQIQTVFHEYKGGPFDEVCIHEAGGSSISIEYKGDYQVATNHTNSCYQAARLMQKLAKRDQGLHIELRKNIPTGAGLAGGSSDAAAVLKGLNELWELNLSKSKLAEIGANIGKDVPFFIYGGTALGTNYGDKIKKLPDLPDLNIKIKWPKEASLTKMAYESIDLRECGKNTSKTELLIKAIKEGDSEALIRNVHNDFDTLLLQKSRLLRRYVFGFAKGAMKIMSRFKKEGAKTTCLSGSGSAVIGVF